MPELAAPVGRLGSLAIVLHSHMPYVEGFGTYPFGEEWLFDAYLRSYLPVLEVAERLTLTVTPVLADQLEAPGVGERLERFVTELRVGYCRREAGAIGGELGAACEAEASRYEHALETLRGLAGELLSPFTEASAAGRVALMSSAAAHAVLPLLATRAARRLQIDAGLRSHHRRFGVPAGFWLPECAYEPGLEGELAELGVEAFCVDQSEFLDPVQTLAPIATAAGPTALAIDWGLISRLWSLSGYPSDPAHQDFHRKSIWGARPWSIAGAPYDPARAQAIARRQAADLTDALGERFRAGAPDGDGLVVFAIDTELIGHWWWEGPIWLAELIRLAPGAGIELVTVPQAVERHSAEPRPLRSSSWGEGKDLRSWDSPPVADLATASRRLELRLVSALRAGALPPARALRAARELMLLQSSDWSFLDGRRQAGDYPFDRSTAHARSLLEAIDSGTPRDSRVRNFAPDLRPSALLEP